MTILPTKNLAQLLWHSQSSNYNLIVSENLIEGLTQNTFNYLIF